jgi:hypothetical protein
VSLHVIVNGLKNLKPQDISDTSGIITLVEGAMMAYDKKKEFQQISYHEETDFSLLLLLLLLLFSRH